MDSVSQLLLCYRRMISSTSALPRHVLKITSSLAARLGLAEASAVADSIQNCMAVSELLT